MASKKTSPTSEAALAAARKRAEQIRQQLQHEPAPSELLTSPERADAAPFYFALRAYIQPLKEAREAAGLTLADVSARTDGGRISLAAGNRSADQPDMENFRAIRCGGRTTAAPHRGNRSVMSW